MEQQNFVIDYKKMAAYIRRREGFSLMPYQCPLGHWTIGYGHNLEGGISAAAADFILREDIVSAMQQVKESFSWFSSLVPARQLVLVDMCFNLGLSGLKGFKKMLAALAAEDYETAAVEMLASRWAGQVGKRAQENAAMMKSGKWIEW